jgi:hypothetical protein
MVARTLLGPALAVIALVGAGAPVRGDEPAPQTPEAIDVAIEKGVGWLVADQDPQGTWGSRSEPLGPTALAVYALLHAGLREGQDLPASRRLARALRWIDDHGPGRERSRADDSGTYAVSLLLLLLRERARPEDRPRMQALADRLVAQQALNGQWDYGGKPPRRSDVGDNSNTHFALFALGAAVGEGLDVPRKTLEAARTWWCSSAQKDGGWGYSSGGSLASASTGSMTCAGIACLALLDAALSAPEGGLPPPSEKARGGLGFLASVFRVDRNHGPTMDRSRERQRGGGRGWLHYYLWTLERAMVLGGHERIAGKDWYALGAAHLLATQKDDGSWRQEHPLYGTCFALLFLSRAADPPRAFTPRPKEPSPAVPVTPRAEEAPATGPDPAQAPEPLPEGTPAEWLGEDLAPGVLAERVRRVGPGALLPLVEALDHPDRARRRRAHEALVELLPEERTRAIDRHPLPRGRLHRWLRRFGRDLVLVEGRFTFG